MPMGLSRSRFESGPTRRETLSLRTSSRNSLSFVSSLQAFRRNQQSSLPHQRTSRHSLLPHQVAAVEDAQTLTAPSQPLQKEGAVTEHLRVASEAAAMAL